MSGNSWVLRLADVAADQGGLLTTAQAGAVGVSPQQVARLARSGALEPVVHGVHRLAGAGADRLGGLRAVWLALEPATLAGDRVSREDPSGVVSHRSAAVVHGFGDVEADVHEFSVSTRRRSRNPEVRLHTAAVDRGSWTVVSGLPVTTVVRTIADLAAVRTDGGHLARVVSEALSGLQVGLEEVAAALRPFAHVYGAPLGDGAALVERFLDEAGIPEATTALVRAVTRTPGGWVPAASDLAAGVAFTRELQRTLAEVTAVMGQVDTAALREVLTSVQVLAAAVQVPQLQVDTGALRGLLTSVEVLAAAVPVLPQLDAARLGEGPGAELARVVQEVTRANVVLPVGKVLPPGSAGVPQADEPDPVPRDGGRTSSAQRRRGRAGVEDA